MEELNSKDFMAISFDILEKSGFQKKEMHTVKGQHYWLYVISPEYHVKIWTRGLHDNPESGFMLYAETAKGVCRMNLKWVHELQHLLRLFEIDKQIIVL